MEERTCLWCGAPIGHMRINAKYCTRQHKKNAASVRHRERNPGYYARYNHCERMERWRQETAVERRRKAREYHRRTGDTPKAAAWRAANKERLRINEQNRRARKRNNPGSVGIRHDDWIALCRRYDYRCAYCGQRSSEALHLDHVIPVAKGGRHAIGNALPACRPCNKSKSARFLAEWRLREKRQMPWLTSSAGGKPWSQDVKQHRAMSTQQSA